MQNSAQSSRFYIDALLLEVAGLDNWFNVNTS